MSALSTPLPIPIPGLERRRGGDLAVHSPIDGAELASLRFDTADEIEAKLRRSVEAFRAWRDVPAPRRGELVRILGMKLRERKEELGRLVTLESGKILTEGLGEVQEMIDICDFAVGLSRQLYGLTIASERPNHVMQENWLPLGPVGVITAFNFPVAVWSWNAALALVCGARRRRYALWRCKRFSRRHAKSSETRPKASMTCSWATGTERARRSFAIRGCRS
jgi:acyl-CoA reductase-like NAD-dependent aldehyde dehydrogenase